MEVINRYAKSIFDLMRI